MATSSAGAESGGDRDEALLHLGGLFLAEIVVNHDDSRKRVRIGRKPYNLLLDAVLQEAEFIAAEISDQPAVASLDGDGDDDDFRVHTDVIARVVGCSFLCGRGCGILRALAGLLIGCGLAGRRVGRRGRRLESGRLRAWLLAARLLAGLLAALLRLGERGDAEGGDADCDNNAEGDDAGRTRDRNRAMRLRDSIHLVQHSRSHHLSIRLTRYGRRPPGFGFVRAAPPCGPNIRWRVSCIVPD